MGRDAVFIDAAGLMGLHLTTDALHETSKLIFANLARARSGFVTSDWVLAEFLNACSAPARRTRAAGVVRELKNDATVEVVPASRESFESALEFHESRPDKEWGLIDCSSFLICRERGIQRVFTHDRHFRQAGFRVLL